MRVETDSNSGFCGGVIRAISVAEKFLDAQANDGGSLGRKLYSLGSIVHNEGELARLGRKGLAAVSKAQLPSLPAGTNILIRAHGEPPETYSQLKSLGLNVIDCTCPVVLRLQKHIREAYLRMGGRGLVVIFGKVGHAEVLGLVGQAGGDALVVENLEMLRQAVSEGRLPSDGPIEVFSQTTKSPDEYEALCSEIRKHVPDGRLTVHNTICSQVASRHSQLSAFAKSHDVIVFVSGKESSNGKVLSDLCRSLNPRTYLVVDASAIRPGWFSEGDRVGVCGATSTPKWLLESVATAISEI